MVQIGKVEDWNPEKLKKRIRSRCLFVIQRDGVRNDPPVGIGETAIGD
jgi:hypothetical protein